MFTVPIMVYPWLCLLVSQIFMPRASFIGHISGIGIGHACKSLSFNTEYKDHAGLLDRLLMKGNWINSVEDLSFFKLLIGRGIYVRNPNSSIPFYYEGIADDADGNSVPVWSRFAGSGRTTLL
jgi:hypothetical protein